MVECWAQSEYRTCEVGGDGVRDQFQEGLPEKLSARRWCGGMLIRGS